MQFGEVALFEKRQPGQQANRIIYDEDSYKCLKVKDMS